jgi:transcriptional regulator with XRE-family HTH domain
MQLSPDSIKKLCKNNGLDLNSLLIKAGVSKTAYYSLIRKESALPKSIHALADVLGVPAKKLLVEEDFELAKHKRLLNKLNTVLEKNPNADRDNVWHTLLLLQEPPITRLRRSLIRGRRINIYQKRN